jgi:glycosyltransferase involved in cell wall biosynthesis
VVYAGTVPYRAMPSLICGSVASLNPYLDLGRAGLFFPVKLFEALACGVPVIATDLPMQADFVSTHECGIVIPTEDAAAIARAVATLVDDPAGAAEMGRRGREAIVSEASWRVRSKATSDVIESAIRGRG